MKKFIMIIATVLIVLGSFNVCVFADDSSEVKDEVVKEFINNYNEYSESPFENTEKGNIRTKYYTHSYGYRFELLHASDTDKINVTIEPATSTGVVGMKDAFYGVVKAIEPSLPDDDIYTYFDQLVSNEYMVTDDPFSTMLIYYFPDKELSSGYSWGHIEVVSQQPFYIKN